MTHYNYIVIGAGSAGCVVANRLTEAPDMTVLLLEAGNLDTKPKIQIPVKRARLLGSEVDWGYVSEPEPYMNDRQIRCSRGIQLVVQQVFTKTLNFCTFEFMGKDII